MDKNPIKLSLFAEGLDHPECVAVHPDGSVWAGGEAGQVYRIPPGGGEVKEITNTGGFVQGLAFSPGSEWLAICDSGNKCVWKLVLSTNELSVFCKGTDAHRFNIPNYAVFDAAGNLYVSESGGFREVTGKILKFSLDGKGTIWHPGPFAFTNGMALGKDGRHLYVVCSWLPGVERISINADGGAGLREVYCTLPQTVPDGVAFDKEENLYITCYIPNAVYRVSPDRVSNLVVDDWEAHTLSNPTNIAFGGEKFDQLFAANLGRWHITRIDLGVEGLPLVSHRKQ